MLKIRPSSIQGLGAFTTQRIEKATRIIEYLGERITHAEGDWRYGDEQGTQAHVLLFIVDQETVIDAGIGGNDAMYINHSCEPNCETVTDSGRVYIEALRTITAGEELTYDYQLEGSENDDPKLNALFTCQCGAQTCRGTMLVPS